MDRAHDVRPDASAPLREHAPVTELDVRHALDGLVFPASADDILDCARDRDDERGVADFLADLVDREFQSLDHLVDAVRTTLEAAGTELDSGLDLRGERALLDINQADLDQLEAIPGIDRELAERIVQVREALGGFRTVDDLLEVGDIDPETLDHIRRTAAI